MRLTYLALLLPAFLISLFSLSQDSAVIQSKFERFSSSTGKMYKWETIEIGNIRDIKVSISKVIDVETGQSEKAILISQIKSMMFTVISAGVLTIDMQEIDGVAKALGLLPDSYKGKQTEKPTGV
jgi:hypothetical protein